VIAQHVNQPLADRPGRAENAYTPLYLNCHFSYRLQIFRRDFRFARNYLTTALIAEAPRSATSAGLSYELVMNEREW
jgi:hypothetical protein